MSAKPEPFEFDIAREFPDGLIVDGVFYPFMVDCPNKELPVTTSKCEYQCGGKQVRNPALEWREVTMKQTPYPDPWEYKWVAVGVKEVSE